jgi:Domain of unknown function (DUF4126)
MELFISICLGVGLAACSGFRVFVPLLLSNIAIHFGLVSVANGFECMGSWTAFAVLASAATLELAGYYIPFVDNLLDTIAIPASVAAGTLLTTSFVQIDNPILHWGLGLMIGGGTAGFVQTSTSLLRLASTKLSGGLGNPVIATIENVVAVGLSLLTFWLPIVAISIVFLLVVWLIKKLITRKKT